MSDVIASLFHPVALGACTWLILLWTHARISRKTPPLAVKLTTGLVTGLILLLPVQGASVGCWAQGFHPNPSLPGVGLIVAALVHRLFGLVLLRPADLRALLIYGAIAGSVLYLHTFWSSTADLYYLGWLDTAAIWTIAVLSLSFLAAGNRMGVILLFALLAFTFSALESDNAWDYLIDPITWMVCTSLLTFRLLRTGWVARSSIRTFFSPARVETSSRFRPVSPSLPPP